MRTPHKVEVQRRTKKKSPYGMVLTPEGDPIQVPCRFRELREQETTPDGIVVDFDARILVPGEWPPGLNDSVAEVRFRGRRYDVHGIPIVRDGSPRTAHKQINLKYVGPVDG